MIEFLLFFLASIIFSSGLILIRGSFYTLAERTLTQLNTLLNDTLEDSKKQKLILTNTGNLLKWTLIFLGSLLLVIAFTTLPFLLYKQIVSEATYQTINFKSLKAIIAILLGAIIPFLMLSFIMKKNRSDYSELSILLHRLLLNNYFVSKMLFRVDKGLHRSRLENTNSNFVIVSGLARAGTTGLATMLSKTNAFHFLKYGDMPFLLSPNIWKKLNFSKNKQEKERQHGDQVLMGYDSIEALEEFFFKAFTNDAYIQKKVLLKHEIEEATYQEYINYQSLIQSPQKNSTLYLAKNNNLILRYASLRQKNDVFKAVFLFRDPVEHASSLLQQHIRFGEIHLNDPFTLEYMDWLGHHEFGLNHKHFQFVEGYNNIYEDQLTLNYWIEIWINYYEYLINFVNDTNLILISYSDLLSEPQKVMTSLAGKLQIKMEVAEVNQFKTSTPSDASTINSALLKRANDLYTELQRYKLN
ncbi:MAG: sulfotransferase [Chitinophagales bacterium]